MSDIYCHQLILSLNCFDFQPSCHSFSCGGNRAINPSGSSSDNDLNQALLTATEQSDRRSLSVIPGTLSRGEAMILEQIRELRSAVFSQQEAISKLTTVNVEGNCGEIGEEGMIIKKK